MPLVKWVATLFFLDAAGGDLEISQSRFPADRADVGLLSASVIIPTLNEVQSVPELLERVGRAIGSRAHEIIVVDDGSTDGTIEAVQQLSPEYPVRLVVRRRPENGLSGAVLRGMAEAAGECLAVMDADLQHPPEEISRLLEPLETGEADMVIGSRHVAGSNIAENWGLWRRLNSRVAGLLARPIAGKIHDPMSGFFAIRREVFARARDLAPVGYKIALELVCKCRPIRVMEIPIRFAQRTRGDSKLSLREQLRYVRHLGRLYAFAFPRLAAAMGRAMPEHGMRQEIVIARGQDAALHFQTDRRAA